MWPPPNIHSLPSKEEIKWVKKEISTIELEIVEAELRLDALRKSLSERKAWIAPIRKIPHEILSLVFIEVSTTDWKAPLMLESISRRWRDVVVDSPKAWTFIPLSKYSSKGRSELIFLFLERSRNAPLHISIENDSLLGYMELLARRIECFNLKTTTELQSCYLQHGHTFCRLERLRIVDPWELDELAPPTDGPAACDMLLFPNLKVLDIHTQSLSLLRAISAAPEFPAIQHLTVYCRDSRRLPEILTKCATSLESVELSYIDSQSNKLHREHKIHFPRLKYLRLEDWSEGKGPCFRIKAATPNLQVYSIWEDISPLNAVKVDTGSVTFLQVDSTPDFSRYPRLVTLCFMKGWGQEEVIEATKCLRDNPILCPELALIEYTGHLTEEQTATAKDALLVRGDVTGHIIQLKGLLLTDHGKRRPALRGVERCGDHMVCDFPI